MADISSHILQHKWQNIPDNSTAQLGVSPSTDSGTHRRQNTEAFFDLQFSFQIIHCYYFCGDHFLKYIRFWPLFEISLCDFFNFYLLYLYSKNRMVLNPHSVLMARNSVQNKPIIPRTILSIPATPSSGR